MCSDEAKSNNWENSLSDKIRYTSDGRDMEMDRRYGDLSPMHQTQIALEHSYSLPPERDPSNSPSRFAPLNRNLFNHDHG